MFWKKNDAENISYKAWYFTFFAACVISLRTASRLILMLIKMHNIYQGIHCL